MIIGFLGRRGAGKSTAAAHAAERTGGRVFSLAHRLKLMARDVLDFTDLQLWGPQGVKEHVDPRYGFSARWFLQRLGTEGVRRHLGPNVWVEALLRDVRAWVTDVWDAAGPIACPRAVAVVEDVRFRNEVRLLRAAGGKIVKLCRSDLEEGGMSCSWVKTDPGAAPTWAQHDSEAEVDMVPDAMIDATIWSAPSPDSVDLKEKVDRTLSAWGLIGGER